MPSSASTSPEPRRQAVLALAALAALAALGGCVEDPPDLRTYARPVPRPAPADPSCKGLEASHPGASFSAAPLTLRIEPGGALLVGDPSVLGGPFEPPLEIKAPPGEYPVRVLLGKTRSRDARPLCVELRLRPGDPARFEDAGEVAIDTDVLALVDGPRYLANVRARGAPIVPGVEALQADMPSLLDALAGQGVPLELELPTFARGTRPARPSDRDTVTATLKRMKLEGRYMAEPEQPGQPFVRALGEAPAARVDVGLPGAAIAVESPGGDGAYRVALGLDPNGVPLVVEIRLSP